MNRLVCGALIVMGLMAGAVDAASITTESLLEEMVDLERLTRLPDPAYTCKQFSSWDRRSKTPDDPKGWFANDDTGHFLRVEQRDGRKEHVMMDAAGPGAIVRIWSANPDAAGIVRIYLDGSRRPTIETPLRRLLDGSYPGLPLTIAGERAKGFNLYFPIPYAKHCLVTAEGEKFYYHINYRTYASGTRVRTFEPADLERHRKTIERVVGTLAAVGRPVEPRSTPHRFRQRLRDGEEKTLETLSGSREITALKLHVDADGDEKAIARGLVLSMSFDGRQTVEAPLGDFFGAAPGFIPYASLPLAIIREEGKPAELWCFWRMPFEKRAEIRIRNWTGVPVDVRGSVWTSSHRWDETSLHFHAGWRIERNIPTRPFIDWNHLHVRGGAGRFVGGHLHFINAVKKWWGEGDERIYVDGEKFPSTFGTGTEDYYGYAWGNPGRFVHAYHNQPHVDGPGTYGNISNNRFHILDDIPFTKSFRFDMENWHWSEDIRVTRAAVSYWYARPGTRDGFKALTRADVQPIEVPPYKVHVVAGAIEGESLALREKRGGDFHTHPTDHRLSNEAVLRWTKAKPGDRATFALPVEKAGTREVVVHLLKSIDYAQVQFYINGRPAGPVIDGYAPQPQPSGEISLGRHELRAGENELTIEIVGANRLARPGYLVGLDYVLLK